MKVIKSKKTIDKTPILSDFLDYILHKSNDLKITNGSIWLRDVGYLDSEELITIYLDRR